MLRLLLAILIFTSPEVIRFTNKDATLEGELMLPDGNAKAPVVVFVHGSGRATRNDLYHRIAALTTKCSRQCKVFQISDSICGDLWDL